MADNKETSEIPIHEDGMETSSPSITITSASADPIPTTSTDTTKYIVYRSRWWILFLFCCGNFCNAMVWITLAPIVTISTRYYNITKTQINLIITLYPICYFVSDIWSTYIFHKYHIRYGIVIGAILTMGVWLRCLSVISPTSGNGLAWLVISELLPALGQSFFCNAPAMIASTWFAPEQRDIATTIAAMSNPLGIALGQVIPTLIVSDDGSGMFILHLIESILCTITFILILIYFRASPPTPPSYATAQQWERRQHDLKHADNDKEAISLDSSIPSSTSIISDTSHIPSMRTTIRWMIRDYGALFRNRHFMTLLVAFGIGLGMFNAVSTLIEQFIAPAGYNTDDAGICGALLIVFGFLGAGILGTILDKTHLYRPLIKLVGTCVFGSMCFVVFALQPNQTAVVYASFGLLGFFMIPLLPVAFQCAVECTYPIAEESSNGLLMLAGQTFGIPVVFILDYTISQHPKYETTATPTAIIIVVIVGIAMIALWLFFGPYHRLQAEAQRKQVTTSNDENYRTFQTSSTTSS